MSDYKLVFFTDDDHDDLDLMREIAESFGHTAQLFNDGETMIDALSSQEQMPHLIFLDITLPKVDGFEILKRLKTSENYKNIPVVIHSANCDDKCVSRAFELGANYFIGKAFTIPHIRASIINAIEKEWLDFKPSRKDFLYQY